MLNAPNDTRLASVTGNVEIWAVGPQWRYDTFGNLTLPSNIAAINYANGVSILSGLGSSSYSNVQVATYLPTYSGNVQSLNITATTGANGPGQGALIVDGAASIAGNLMLGQSIYIDGNITLYGDNIRAKSTTILSVGTVNAGNVSVPGTSGKIGFSSGGFAQQATSNSTQVTSHFTSGNIQLMSIDLGASAAHTVPFSCNKLTTNDILVVKHVSGGVTSVYVDAYVQSDGLAIIWMRDITGVGTGAFTAMLKYAIIQAPSS